MKPEEIDELMKEADTKGDGKIYIEDVCQRLCPPKPKWTDFEVTEAKCIGGGGSQLLHNQSCLFYLNFL